MEFDKSRVYTTLNADELKIGSTIIPADNLMELKCRVKKESMLFTLTSIREESNDYRFTTDNGSSWALVYLVSKPEEKKLKWTDLKIGDIITDGKQECMVVSIDKSKDSLLKICINNANGSDWLSDEELEEWKKVEEVI